MSESTIMRYTIFLLWLTTWVSLVRSSGMLSHVERYDVVKPHRLQGRDKRSLSPNQTYPDVIGYELTIEGRNHTISLVKNRGLLGSDYIETHYTDDGRRVTRSPKEDHCYYHGHIEGIEDSSVSVGICSGISGFVRAKQQVYLIEPLGERDDDDHAVYRQERLRASGRPSCGSSPNSTNSTVYDNDQDMSPKLSGLHKSRSWNSKPIAGPQRYVELFLVVDNAEYKRYGSQTKTRMLGVVNHIDKLYRALNIRIVLVGLEIWSDINRFEVDYNPDKTLDRFLAWRLDDLLKRTKHDNAQFVTGIDFSGDTVGLANKFAMCSVNSGGINQDHHKNSIGLASTIAHEMGHNFGMSHDDSSDCMCRTSFSGQDCIMAHKLQTGNQGFPEFFSACSKEQLAEFLERAQPSCLLKPTSARTIDLGPRCGNGLVDPEEECDCGTIEECQNPCCDASTCRLTEGARCAHGQCCDNCQLKQAGSVCRKSSSDCDLPEYCTGASEHCPEDSFEMNGKQCSDHGFQGFCYNGQCPTLQQHCWRLFGTTVGSDACFDMNKSGRKGANCGRSRYSYARCSEENKKCGSVFCEGDKDSISITGQKAIFTGAIGDCLVAVDEDSTRSLDLAPNGTRCGVNKVCINQRCVGITVYGEKDECANKCNNNGVCNHKNECHCHPGWAPPYCNAQYAGFPQDQSGVIAGVCAAVAMLLVLALVVAILMCCKREKRENYTSKRKVHSAQGKLNPMFQEGSTKSKPQISAPTFMESTATQACTPLMVTVVPSRAAPKPPKVFTPELATSTSHTVPTKPLPPSKPLPPLYNKQASKPKPPPVPPVKPSLAGKPCTPPVPPAKPKVPKLT